MKTKITATKEELKKTLEIWVNSYKDGKEQGKEFDENFEDVDYDVYLDFFLKCLNEAKK